MKKQFILYVLLMFSAVFFVSCDDEDPVSSEVDHYESIGMVFYDSGIEIARILRGETTDTLTTTEGGMSSHIEVKFLNENEEIIDSPDNEDKTLAWEFEDATIADIWQHDGEEGAFDFHLEGLKEGETSIEFFVMHEGHSDYRSGEIPVKIEHEADDNYGAPVGYYLIDEESGNTLLTLAESGVTGALSVNVNETSDHIEVEFFDANGIEFQPAAPPHALLVESSDTNILQITGLEEDEPWAFKIQGVSSGNATITIKLMHDEIIGKEFVPINVTVN